MTPFFKKPIHFFGGVLALVMAIVVSYFVLFPQVWHCEWVGYSSFREIAPRFFVSPDTPPIHQQKATRAIVEAEARVCHFWGKRVGKPTVILCHTTAQYERYCHSDEGAGCSIGTPWGASYIVLNLDGLNTDVIAHEMCHDELFTRLGWWTTTRQIPQWFNEGLALMVDYRFVPLTDSVQRYIDYKDEYLFRSNGGQIMLDLKQIASTRGFFGGDEQHVMLAYMSAGAEVARWLATVGEQRLSALTERVARGESFAKVYAEIERRSAQSRKKSQ
ncbi:MAG: hypothetical protein MUE30_00685 [Spirosomaceae bacterium]|jgi:hypothetical protein|nr:hypothetical protein [Spirosomataceae bacterium]